MSEKKNKENNLPVVIDGIKNQLVKRREKNIFPLTPTHRKELRMLRNSVVGNLRSRVKTIKKIKLEEYQEKYKDDIIKGNEIQLEHAEKINNSFIIMMEKINSLVEKQIALEDKFDLSLLDIKTDYNDLSKLKFLSGRRNFVFDSANKCVMLAKEKFDQKYGVAFEQTLKKLNELDELYEEAVNFGDLEMVKELYYTMKGADKFLEKISNIEV